MDFDANLAISNANPSHFPQNPKVEPPILIDIIVFPLVDQNESMITW